MKTPKHRPSRGLEAITIMKPPQARSSSPSAIPYSNSRPPAAILDEDPNCKALQVALAAARRKIEELEAAREFPIGAGRGELRDSDHVDLKELRKAFAFSLPSNHSEYKTWRITVIHGMVRYDLTGALKEYVVKCMARGSASGRRSRGSTVPRGRASGRRSRGSASGRRSRGSASRQCLGKALQRQCLEAVPRESAPEAVPRGSASGRRSRGSASRQCLGKALPTHTPKRSRF